LVNLEEENFVATILENVKDIIAQKEEEDVNLLDQHIQEHLQVNVDGKKLEKDKKRRKCCYFFNYCVNSHCTVSKKEMQICWIIN